MKLIDHRIMRGLVAILSIVIIIVVVLPVLQAQSISHTGKDTLIVFCKNKKKGLYRSLDQFKANAPFVSYEANLVKKTEFVYAIEGSYVSYKLDLDKKNLPCAKGSLIWGFCDGTRFFISRSEDFSKNNVYDEIIYIGRYLYYKSVKVTAGSAPMMMSGGVMMGGGGGAKYLHEYAIDINSGHQFLLTKDELRNILSKDDVLLKEFEEEKKKRYVLGEYLIKYAEKHKDEME